MVWDRFKRLIGRQASAAIPADTSKGNTERKELAAKAPTQADDVIAYAVRLAGLVNGNPESLGFYRAAFADHPANFVSYVDLRKRGDLLDKDALKRLGLRGNVKLSAQFVATLNEHGLADPLQSAGVIGLTISNAICSRRDLDRKAEAGIELTKFRASNMAAGPCDHAAKLDNARIRLSDAELLPFGNCPHPDQCACSYQSWLAILED